MSEVSTLSTSSYLNHSSRPSDADPDPRAPPTDRAHLLRQAALSSRKLKRRRPDATASFSRPLPRSFASTSSISLDYGQEEPPSTAPTSEPPPAPAPAQASTPTQTVTNSSPGGVAPQNAPGDDDSTREEGEISENEDPPFRPPEKPIFASTTITGAPYAARLESSGSVQSRSPFSLRSRSPSVKAEDAYQHATPPPSATTLTQRSSAEASPVVLETQAPSESFTLETPLYVLDTNHVRPGLSLTQKEYDTAKEVILDILGYGVPPEYLIDCGLSRAIIYYVFTELNLRLPDNLDTTGIPPYPPPPEVLASVLLSQSTSPSATTGGNDDITQHGSFGYPNSIPRPLVPHDSVMAPQAIASLDDPMSASTLALSESTLSAIERQRKQELLARKAVQASRKRKEPVPLSITQASASPTASTGDDTSAKPSASAVSVDDFLNSIGPPLSGATASPDRDPSATEASGLTKVSSPEPMNVDEIIPGFGRNTLPDYDQPEDRMSVPPSSEDTSLPRSASASERSFSVERGKDKTTSLSTHKTLPALENVTTRSRSDEMLGPHLARDGERDSRRSFSTPQPTAPIPRRGTKRPVAADFDSEPMPKAYYTPPVLSRSGSSAGLSYGSAYHPNPHVRRKMNGAAAGGFASLNSARRCVIDVSDSEDDTSEDDETSSTARGSHPSVGGIGNSALALELEIERMRKMIREREEMKLRKQAMASSRATPVSRESPAVVRASEGETSEVAAPSSTTTGVEIARSEAGNNKMSKNVPATTSAPSSPRLDLNNQSPISSTPSPPGFSPVSSFQDSGRAQVAVHASSTDQSATPAEGNQTVGGPALAAEARQESAASSRPSTPSRSTGPALHGHASEDGTERESFDVIAQVPDVKANSSFTAYNSVLSPYPFLSGRSLGPQEQVDIPNLKRLRMQAAARYMTENNLEDARICHYEVPGCGECRDKDCGDMHLSQVQVEPNDDETARYLCGDQNVSEVVQALQAARTRRPEATFDERVNEVWANMRDPMVSSDFRRQDMAT